MAELQKILHVDDDDDIRIIAKMALEVVGNLTVEQCSSGMDALEVAPQYKPDLFLLDVMMPVMGGEETWQKLRNIPGMENVPAIFMTAKAQDAATGALIELGAIAVITKPFDPMELCSQIRSAWDRHQNSG